MDLDISTLIIMLAIAIFCLGLFSFFSAQAPIFSAGHLILGLRLFYGRMCAYPDSVPGYPA